MRASGPGEFPFFGAAGGGFGRSACRTEVWRDRLSAFPPQQRLLASHPDYFKFTRATRGGGRAAPIKWLGGSPPSAVCPGGDGRADLVETQESLEGKIV